MEQSRAGREEQLLTPFPSPHSSVSQSVSQFVWKRGRKITIHSTARETGPEEAPSTYVAINDLHETCICLLVTQLTLFNLDTSVHIPFSWKLYTQKVMFVFDLPSSSSSFSSKLGLIMNSKPTCWLVVRYVLRACCSVSS